MKEVIKIENSNKIVVKAAVVLAGVVAARLAHIYLLYKLDPTTHTALYAYLITSIVARVIRTERLKKIAKSIDDSKDEIQIDIEPKEKVLTLNRSESKKMSNIKTKKDII